MGKKLALRGHVSRGKEIIELLKMMGGKNTEGYIGVDYDEIYTIEDGYIIQSHDWNNCLIFTLEEFLEKYPFKVGDLKDLIDDHISCVISEMCWNELAECMEYHAEFGPNDYGWYKVYDFCHDYQIEEHNTVISGINLNSCDYADEVELNLGDYEIEVRDGRTYAVKKKPKYPTTYEECFNVYTTYSTVSLLTNKTNVLYDLLICRNVYWKIAGDEMGLGKSWDSTYGCGEWGYWIGYSINENKIYLQDSRILVNHTLVFPTAEMRDAFYENFKDLIEQCKELL